MSKLVAAFLKEVKEKKIEQLLGIKLDQKYWAGVIGNTDVEELRKELGLEKEKMVKNRNGTIFKDNRDMDKINSLNEQITILEKAEQELVRLKQMEKGITDYMVFVDKPSEEAMKELEEVAKL